MAPLRHRDNVIGLPRYVVRGTVTPAPRAPTTVAFEDSAAGPAASVIGKDVSYALLQGISDMPEASLRRGLTHLQAAEFLYETNLLERGWFRVPCRLVFIGLYSCAGPEIHRCHSVSTPWIDSRSTAPARAQRDQAPGSIAAATRSPRTRGSRASSSQQRGPYRWRYQRQRGSGCLLSVGKDASAEPSTSGMVNAIRTSDTPCSASTASRS